jgi:DNA repair photolyase
MLLGPNLKSLSDEDLYKKISDVSQKMVKAAHANVNSTALAQLRNHLQSLQSEREERQMALWRQKEEEKNPNKTSVVVETDPDMVGVPFVPPKPRE